MTPDIVISILFGLKLFILIGLALYIIFALILVRQEQLMADVLEEIFEPVLRIITIVHLLASIGVFFLALIVL